MTKICDLCKVNCILCPSLTQSSSTQPNAAHAFRNLCDPIIRLP